MSDMTIWFLKSGQIENIFFSEDYYQKVIKPIKEGLPEKNHFEMIIDTKHIKLSPNATKLLIPLGKKTVEKERLP